MSMFPFTVAGPRRTHTDFPFNSAMKKSKFPHTAPTSSAGYLM
ncbi:hypothetical protein C1A50_1427 [Paenibacillus polymyxa]|nr:hypothetical protein C1A50_1427 [Paenibacillus polymyxa]